MASKTTATTGTKVELPAETLKALDKLARQHKVDRETMIARLVSGNGGAGVATPPEPDPV